MMIISLTSPLTFIITLLKACRFTAHLWPLKTWTDEKKNNPTKKCINCCHCLWATELNVAQMKMRPVLGMWMLRGPC